MTIEKYVFGCVGDLWRLVVIVDVHLLGRLICWSHVRRQKRSIYHDPNDLVRLKAKSMGKSAEILSAVDGQAAKQERPVQRQLPCQDATLALQGLDSLNSLVQAVLPVTWLRWAKCQRAHSSLGVWLPH